RDRAEVTKSSPRQSDTLGAWIYSRGYRARGFLYHDAAAGVHGPSLADFNFVAAKFQFRGYRIGHTALERQVARIHRVREWRGRKTAGGPARRFDGLLDVHPELDHIQERLHGAHALIVPALASGNQDGLAVAHDQGALQRAPRTLAGF